MGKKKLTIADTEINKKIKKTPKNRVSIIDMYKKAVLPEDVIVLYEECEYINDVSRLTKLIIEYPKLIKEVVTNCAIDYSINFKDMSLMARGYKEDEAFAIEPFLLKNIRRGNTLIEITKEGKIEKEVIARKGLIKFFDL